MNKIILVIFILFLTFGFNTIQAQDTLKKAKTKEFFLSPQSFSPITVSFGYKQQIKNRTFFKLDLMDLSYSSISQSSSTTAGSTGTNTVTAGIEAGIEFRNFIRSNFSFFYGPNIYYNYRFCVAN